MEKKPILTIVLPFALCEETRRERWRFVDGSMALVRIRTLFISLATFFDMTHVASIIVICPSRDLQAMEDVSLYSGLCGRVSVVPEEDVLPELAHTLYGPEILISGWQKQQLLKIKAAAQASTDWTLILDSDVLCSRPCSAYELGLPVRPFLNVETTEDYLRLYKESFALSEARRKVKRLRTSQALLDYEPCPADRTNSFIGETPVLLSTPVVQDLLARLTRLYGPTWPRFLVGQQGWTEYTLYYALLLAQNATERLYRPTSCDKILNLTSSIWQCRGAYRVERANEPADLFRRIGPENEGYFITIQSWLPADCWLPSRFPAIRQYYEELHSLMEQARCGVRTYGSTS